MGYKNDTAPRLRPYWHVDAKWISGLILVFVLSLMLLTYNLVKITAEKPAVDTMAAAMAITFSQNGLDDTTEIEKVRETLRKNPGGSIQPIPGLKITIKEQDIANLSPREARLYFFRQLAEPIYKNGPEGVAELANNPEMKKAITGSAGALGILSLKTHQTLKKVLLALATISLLLFILLIFFSHRFGQLFSPGIVILIASLPGALLFTTIKTTLPLSANLAPPSREDGISGMAGYLASNTLPPLLQIISRNYILFLLTGLALILISVVGRLVYKFTIRRKTVEDDNTGQPQAA